MRVWILLGLMAGPIIQNSIGQDFHSSREDFFRMARYLAEGSGKWMAPNPKHHSDNPLSHHALGLWFELSLKENLLDLSIVAYRGDTVHIASHSMWIWHPGEQRIKYFDINARGIFTEGETYFNSDKLFVTRNFTHLPNGDISFARGENIIISKDEHFTRSLRYENGEWREQASFTWKKTGKHEGYKVIKYH